jgi:hypothetical protein
MMINVWRRRRRREKKKRLTVPGLIKAMAPITVRRQHRDRVTAFLQRDGGVDDQSLRAADAEVRVDEDDGERWS